ncbi:hypothetical protein BDW59DRAFT_97360 [Aspergillus cavernicola]|uniref:Zn(2)-C6 fungal-type domain-containing protein n=1 Tax=Aspergillus cavernicola TaxID=176166 RepID=A0ABR4I778_9EURO
MATNRRVTRPRSRNGCITCKIRHVKCDEEKPACSQCQKSGRACDGYDDASQTQLRQRIAERHRPIERDTFGADHRLVLRQETRTERRYVDFFYSRTSHAFSGFYDSKLWSYLIPQLGEHEPSIRHAMTAIGAIHSRVQNAKRLPSPEEGSAPTERFVLEEYNKSIQNLVKSLSSAKGQNLHLTLTSCCLFICLEMLRGNQTQALDHIEAGLRIIHKHEQTAAAACSSVLYRELRSLFLRLNLQASFFGRLLIPLKLTSSETIRQISIFTDFPESRIYLDQLMTKALLFIRSIGIMREERDPTLQLEFEAEQEHIRQDFLAWRWSHDKLLHKLGPKITPSDLCASLLQRIYYHTSLFWVLTVLGRDEDLFDNYIPDFESVVSYAEEIVRINSSSSPSIENSADFVFSLEGEIIGPLYYTSTRCRHPQIRRRAIEIMRHYSKREGMWDAKLYCAVAKLVIEVEESQCVVPPTSEKDIGSLIRIYEHVQSRERDINPALVILYMKPDGIDGPWTMRSVMVDW